MKRADDPGTSSRRISADGGRASSRLDLRTGAALVAGIAAGLLLFGRSDERASLTNRNATDPARAPVPATAPSHTAEPESNAASGRAAPTAVPRIRFSDVTRQAGIRFTHVNGRTGRYRYPEIMGAGVALFDYDGDSDLDIYLVNGNRLEGPADPGIKSALYRNDGDGTFTDVAEQAGVASVGYGQGVCVGDADGDGHLDLYVTFLGPNRFFRNRGDGTFASMEKAAGLEDERWGQGCAFLDYDGDGLLDLYLLNYLTYSLEMPQERFILLGGEKAQDYLGPQPFEGSPSRLFRNRGNGTFADVSRAAGIHRPGGKGMGLATVDLDGDGRTDIFQANDGIEDYLFRNLGGGRFAEIGLTSGVAVGGDGQPKGSMGVDAGDLDNDGDLDLAIPVVRQEIYSLFRNEGAFFADVSAASGLSVITGRLTGFSAHFADFDQDGDLDLFFTNGEVQTHERAAKGADDLARFGTPDSVLANDGAGRFSDVSRDAGAHFSQAWIGRGAAAGDLDGDGDLDLVISNCAGPAVVLRNDSSGGNWLALDLRDKGPNWQAIGAQVRLTAAGRRQYRELHGGGGYLSANTRRLHFGLGAATQVDELEIRWPDGTRETRRGLPVNRNVPIVRETASAR